MKSASKLIGGVILILIGVLIIVGLIKFGTFLGFFMLYPWVLSQILRTPINTYLAQAIALVIATGLYFGLYQYVYKRNRNMGLVLVVIVMIAQSLFMFFVSKDQLYSITTGEPIKYYTTNPVSGEIMLFDRPVYDAFGKKAIPVDYGIAKEIYRQKNVEKFPNDEVSFDKIKNFFDPMTGKALVYCSQDSKGYHFFLREGFDSMTGKKLEPVTSEIVEKVRATMPKDVEQKSEQAVEKATVSTPVAQDQPQNFEQPVPPTSPDQSVINHPESKVVEGRQEDIGEQMIDIRFTRGSSAGYKIMDYKGNPKWLYGIKTKYFSPSRNCWMFDNTKVYNLIIYYTKPHVASGTIYWALPADNPKNLVWHAQYFDAQKTGNSVIIYIPENLL